MKTTGSPVTLTTGPLEIADVVSVARAGRGVRLSPAARSAMASSRRLVEAAVAAGEARYGINTGFGSLAKSRINDADLRTLQLNLVRSHAAGIGEPLRPELSRAVVLLLAGSLARGLSGVRPVVAERLVAMLNAGVTPVIPSVGSVGASGDLSPLAHAALVLVGEGRAWVGGREMSGAAALARAGVEPIVLGAKEGLALINGTHLMAAEGALLAHDCGVLLRQAALALAMSMDACRATHAFLDARLALARNNPSLAAVSAVLRGHLGGSQIAASHLENDPRVQDPYSLRAGPTVLAAVADAFTRFAGSMADELGAVTDNPIVFPQGPLPSPLAAAMEAASPSEGIVSGANFHGMPLAIPLDALAIAISHLAGVSERRTYLMTGAFEPESHLRPFLAPRPGLQSGLMIAQYTAAAAVNECANLAAPATVFNVPTCAGMEDYNSFGPRAAAKARRSLELARHVVAIEMLVAAQAIELHRPLRSGPGVEAAHRLIRSVVPPLTEDRSPSPDIAAIVGLLAGERLPAHAPSQRPRGHGKPERRPRR